MTALITGGARGIGLALARLLVARGDRVHVVDRDPDAVQAARCELGAACSATVADVRSVAAVERAVDDCEALRGPIDLAVANAGYARSCHVLETDEATWRELIDVNLLGVARTCRAAGRRMAARGRGTILVAASSSSIASEPGLAAYDAAKAGVLALARAAAHDLAPAGVRVHAVLPGNCLGPGDRWPSVESGRLYDARIAAGRSAAPPEIAAAYAFLSSPDAAATSGTALIVDGGMLAWE
jgi:NAD(P)-dependent dehydrogenase (short-subunit alcohol dehydrogenase family)